MFVLSTTVFAPQSRGIDPKHQFLWNKILCCLAAPKRKKVFDSFVYCPFVLKRTSFWCLMFALPTRLFDSFVYCPFVFSNIQLWSWLIVTLFARTLYSFIYNFCVSCYTCLPMNLNVASFIMKESNILAYIATFKQHQKEILLDTKGQNMKESNTLAANATTKKDWK